MQLLVLLWQMVPPAWQPFLVSGPLAAFGCTYVYYLFRARLSVDERENERWEAEQQAAMRVELDRKNGRITELEEKVSSLHRQGDDAADSMRRAHDAALARKAEEAAGLQRDARRGWDLARAWCDVAHQLRHRIANELARWPEDKRGEMVPPLPALEELRGVAADAIPPRFVSMGFRDAPPPAAP